MRKSECSSLKTVDEEEVNCIIETADFLEDTNMPESLSPIVKTDMA